MVRGKCACDFLTRTSHLFADTQMRICAFVVMSTFSRYSLLTPNTPGVNSTVTRQAKEAQRVSREATKNTTTPQVSVRSLARRVGRVAIWVLIAFLLASGLGSALSGAPRGTSSLAAPRWASDDPGGEALAVRFARAYLADPASRASASLVAEGVRLS